MKFVSLQQFLLTISNIEKLLYGKANLADILVKYNSISTLVPKINQIKKDFEFQAMQVDTMKQQTTDFVRSVDMRAALDTIRNDAKVYTDELVRQNYKEMNFLVEEKLHLLDKVPDKTEYLRRVEFLRFQQMFNEMQDKVERLTDVMVKGYQAEAAHVLKSKVSRTEVEDLLIKKFEHERGKDLEKEQRKTEKKLEKHEEKMESISFAIQNV
jgi:hypothetical protein